MKITFLGTAGGRIVVMTQLRASGGWVLEMDGERIHVDPGPGSLVRAKQYKVDLLKLTAVIVSHAHPDHYTDADVVIESMTRGALRKRGVIIGNENVIKGDEDHRMSVSPYHQKLADRVEIMKPGDTISLGKIKITAVPTVHGEDRALGFVFRGSKTVGFTGDSEYFEGQERYFKGCDYMIVNVLRPRNARWPEHMNSEDAAELLSKIKPKLAILQHFGMKMLRADPVKEARWIESQSGVKTMAAKDGMVLEL